mgnify:CR=1 FL=1
MKNQWRSLLIFALAIITFGSTTGFLSADPAAPLPRDVQDDLQWSTAQRGIAVVIARPGTEVSDYVVNLAKRSKLTVFFQSPGRQQVRRIREAASQAGLLGKRIFVELGSLDRLHLADNLADVAFVDETVAADVSEKEILRVLRPGGRARLGVKELSKPRLEGSDSWSHPYHGPDNNPQSTDRVAKAPYLTQFIAAPKFSPMPQISVGAGGRIYRAFGHIAHKANQNAMLNTLICASAYNGTILWKRPLKPGFMIHRNTMVATDDHLYMADNESCKVIDGASGKIISEISIAKGIADGPVWKWMAIEKGVLYALVGATEIDVTTRKSDNPGLGHWPWGMWQGHDYKNSKTNFGYGRTFVAIDLATKKLNWSHSEKEYLDSRGVCMRSGKIYYCSPRKFLAALDTKKGKQAWKNTDKNLLDAIGTNARAQHYVTGYATTTYIKCTDDFLFFAGPVRSRLVCASARDGQLLWQNPVGNLQLVLRKDGIYAAGPQRSSGGMILDYATGKVLKKMPWRRACTRATGSIDSVFFRANGGTVRIDTESNTATHIAPMRPPCQDGVIISDGHLYWGPWMCGCQLSLYGHISLCAAGDQLASPGSASPRHEPGEGDTKTVAALSVRKNDWPAYQGNNRRMPKTAMALPDTLGRAWTFTPPSAAMPTAPVTAGGLVFLGDRAGVVRALDGDGREVWKAYTGGAVYFPPAVSGGRVYAGSADGRVYAFEASTGRRLWSYRVAPTERWLPVFNRLISTWPVAGGVLVENGRVYAAAGIAHYDGTHVVALDAATGKLEWQNDSSGTQSASVQSGVSMQGSLFLDGGQLCFLGGGIYETARFDLDSGKCLNQPLENVSSRYRTAFYPYYPEYGNYVSLDHSFPDGRSLVFDASYEGNRFTWLTLVAPLPPGSSKVKKDAARWGTRRGWSEKRKVLWQDKKARRFSGLIVAPEKIIATGDAGARKRAPFFSLIRTETGEEVWSEPLPSLPVKGGLAIDADGRILVSLASGQVLCYRADRGN